MAASCLAVTIGLYLFCSFELFFSFVLHNHLVCLYHIDHGIPLDLAVITTPVRTLGNALCQFSCTKVVVPYGLVWSVICECLPR